MNTSLANSTDEEVKTLDMFLFSPSVLSFQVINLSLSLPLNIYVLILLLRAGGLNGPEIFSLNQSVTEILFTLQVPLFIIHYVNMRHLCVLQAVMFFTGTCIFSRLLFQYCVCFQRYVAVIHPVTFLKYKSVNNRVMSSVLIWILSVIGGTVCSKEYLNMPFTVLAVLSNIFLSFHIFFCVSILRVLRRQGPGERERKDGEVNVAKKKAFEIVFLRFLAFLFQTFPLVVLCSTNNKISIDAFSVLFIVYMDVNIAAGSVHPILILHQMGKLTVKCT